MFIESLESRRLMVTVAYTYVGDASLDGVVNALDFNALATNFGVNSGTWSQGEFNYDGSVNSLDFNALAANYGSTYPGSFPLTPVPGDATSDRIVDTRDFGVVARNLGNHTSSLKKGDVNHDGRVNVLDSNLIAQNFGLKS